jgi:hypothetical protein
MGIISALTGNAGEGKVKKFASEFAPIPFGIILRSDGQVDRPDISTPPAGERRERTPPTTVRRIAAPPGSAGCPRLRRLRLRCLTQQVRRKHPLRP